MPIANLQPLKDARQEYARLVEALSGVVDRAIRSARPRGNKPAAGRVRAIDAFPP